MDESASPEPTYSDRISDREFTYALEWFKYHAGQRYESFKVYATQLIAVSIGATGTFAVRATELSGGQDGYGHRWLLFVGLFASIYGLATSVIFFYLDKRNAELVTLGENALRDCERLFTGQGTRILERKRQNGNVRRGIFESHQVMVKLFYRLGMVVFGVGAALTAFLLLKTLPLHWCISWAEQKKLY